MNGYEISAIIFSVSVAIFVGFAIVVYFMEKCGWDK